MPGYNGINSVKTNLAKAGICKHDGLRFTDPKCTHATADQIAYTKKLDADYDFMQEHKDQARLCNRVVEDVSPRLNLLLDVCGDIDAGNGEILPIEVGGVDAVDAQQWQDEPTIEDITVNAYAFNRKRAKIENDMRQKLADEYNKLFAK